MRTARSTPRAQPTPTEPEKLPSKGKKEPQELTAAEPETREPENPKQGKEQTKEESALEEEKDNDCMVFLERRTM